jgi:hypothetical protein
MFLLEYAMRVKQSCSWPFYPKYVMTVLISVSTVGKHPRECNRNSFTREDMREVIKGAQEKSTGTKKDIRLFKSACCNTEMSTVR